MRDGTDKALLLQAGNECPLDRCIVQEFSVLDVPILLISIWFCVSLVPRLLSRLLGIYQTMPFVILHRYLLKRRHTKAQHVVNLDFTNRLNHAQDF